MDANGSVKQTSGLVFHPNSFSTGPSRSVPGYAFPFTKREKHIQKRARLQPVPLPDCIYLLTNYAQTNSIKSASSRPTHQRERQLLSGDKFAENSLFINEEISNGKTDSKQNGSWCSNLQND